MRLAGGAWCIGALILTNYYSSALTSLITVSVPQFLVNSVEELAHNDNIGLVVVKVNYMYNEVISVISFDLFNFKSVNNIYLFTFM